MTVDELITNYPRLYHMANSGTWGSIKKWGLLSTTATLDLLKKNGPERFQIESCHRPKSVTLKHAEHGNFTIRDQVPMRESALLKCLEDMTPREWYELLNRKAFFWVTEQRVLKLLGAKLYREKEHLVLTIDTRSLLAVHGDRVLLSPINSGSTLYNPPKRGRSTFLPISEYPFDERRRSRNVASSLAELTVDYSVPDLFNHTVRAESRKGSKILSVLYVGDKLAPTS